MTYPSIPRSRQPSLSPLTAISQVLLALAGGLALFIILLMVVLIGFDVMHANRVYPGVSVAGVDLSGLSREEAAFRLSESLTYPLNGQIVFQENGDAGRTWIARPAEVGLFLDPENSALAAYRFGRQGNPLLRVADQFDAWYTGHDLPVLLVYDGRIAHRYLEAIANQVNLPTIEATLGVNGLEVVSQPGQVGRTLDIQATLAPLEGDLRNLSDSVVPLVIHEQAPTILDASEQAAIARKLLSEPLELALPDAQEGDPGPWKIEPQQLAAMLKIQQVEGPEGTQQFQVGVNEEALRTYVSALGPSLAVTPSNGRFIFNDETRQLDPLQPSTIGRSLNLEASLKAIQEGLARGEHKLPIVVDLVQPQVPSDAKAADLGITQVVSEQTTYFYGSSGSRLQNIETAAASFHGLLVPPGATFSMAEVLGDISLDNGYAEALIIYGNRTIQGVGGGVCQVSTTLFRTVFFGGYPIAERYPHAYRVTYYEQNAGGGVNQRLAGLDAAVFVPEVDFKFTNDTPNWLLMETYFNRAGRSLTWKFYSTSDGRSVEWDSTGLQNITTPEEPLYQENPELARGEINQIDYEVEGADVTIYRTVQRNGQVYFEDSFATHYLPWRAIYEYGPGTRNIPEQERD